MMRNRDIRQLQQILLMRKLCAYLLVLKYFRLMKAVADGKVIGEYIYNGKGQRIIKKTARLRTGSLVSPVGAIPSPYAGVDFGLDALIGFTTGKGETTCCTQ